MEGFFVIDLQANKHASTTTTTIFKFGNGSLRLNVNAYVYRKLYQNLTGYNT